MSSQSAGACRRVVKGILDLTSSDRILEAAEQLIGELGLGAVSLRQISQASAHRNKYAVQYHFGDLDGVLAAIRAKRLPEIEAERALVFAKAARQGKLSDTRALLDVLYLPLLKHDGGSRRHARFVLALHNAPSTAGDRQRTFEAMPIAEEAFQLLAEANPKIPSALLFERVRIISLMVLSSVFARRAPFDNVEDDGALVGQVLDMAAAALQAPVSNEVDELLARLKPHSES